MTSPISTFSPKISADWGASFGDGSELNKATQNAALGVFCGLPNRVSPSSPRAFSLLAQSEIDLPDSFSPEELLAQKEAPKIGFLGAFEHEEEHSVEELEESGEILHSLAPALPSSETAAPSGAFSSSYASSLARISLHSAQFSQNAEVHLGEESGGALASLASSAKNLIGDEEDEKEQQADLPASPKSSVVTHDDIRARYRKELCDIAKTEGIDPTEAQLDKVMKWAQARVKSRELKKPKKNCALYEDNTLFGILKKQNWQWYLRFSKEWDSISRRSRSDDPWLVISVTDPFSFEGWKNLLTQLRSEKCKIPSPKDCEGWCAVLASLQSRCKRLRSKQEPITLNNLWEFFQKKSKKHEIRVNKQQSKVLKGFIESHFVSRQTIGKKRKNHEEEASSPVSSPNLPSKKRKMAPGNADE